MLVCVEFWFVEHADVRRVISHSKHNISKQSAFLSPVIVESKIVEQRRVNGII